MKKKHMKKSKKAKSTRLTASDLCVIEAALLWLSCARGDLTKARKRRAKKGKKK